MNTPLKRSLFGAALILASACFTTVASAGTYQTSTTAGAFTGITPSYTAASTGDALDFKSIQITNDSNFIYVNVTFNTAVNPDDGSSADGGVLYLGIDTDNNPATGYNLFGSGIGSDLGEDPFGAFAQTSSSYNAGSLPSSDDALVTNYDTTTTEQIVEIPLDALELNGTTPYFTPGSTIGLQLYDENSSDGDTTPDISYTLATAASTPEPKTWALIIGAMGVLLVMARRHRAQV